MPHFTLFNRNFINSLSSRKNVSPPPLKITLFFISRFATWELSTCNSTKDFASSTEHAPFSRNLRIIFCCSIRFMLYLSYSPKFSIHYFITINKYYQKKSIHSLYNQGTNPRYLSHLLSTPLLYLLNFHLTYMINFDNLSNEVWVYSSTARATGS